MKEPLDHSSAPGCLFIFGAGGSGRETAWLARQVLGNDAIISFLVNEPRYLRETINGFPVRLLRDIDPKVGAKFVVALGDPRARERCAAQCNAVTGFRAKTLVHPTALISPWVEIGPGTVICANCIITCNVHIGSHVQINLAATVSHDTVIGDYSTLSPGVRVSGNVRIGSRVFIGTNASIINGHSEAPLTIGDDAVIAAGACVTRPVEPGSLVAGVPAVRKR